jgi:translation initiation factor IF-2
VVGFNVKVEPAARELAERQGVTVETFDIIYKLTEWLAALIEERRPRA